MLYPVSASVSIFPTFSELESVCQNVEQAWEDGTVAVGLLVPTWTNRVMTHTTRKTLSTTLTRSTMTPTTATTRTRTTATKGTR